MSTELPPAVGASHKEPIVIAEQLGWGTIAALVVLAMLFVGLITWALIHLLDKVAQTEAPSGTPEV